MSDLLGHIAAMRALAEAFAFQANECDDPMAEPVMFATSAAYSRAADSLEAKMREGCFPDLNPITLPRKRPQRG